MVPFDSSSLCLAHFLALYLAQRSVILSIDDVDYFWLSSRNIVPFGWLMKLGKRIALFILFLSGGALLTLPSEGMEALIALPSVLLSLLYLNYYHL